MHFKKFRVILVAYPNPIITDFENNVTETGK